MTTQNIKCLLYYNGINQVLGKGKHTRCLSKSGLSRSSSLSVLRVSSGAWSLLVRLSGGRRPSLSLSCLKHHQHDVLLSVDPQ